MKFCESGQLCGFHESLSPRSGPQARRELRLGAFIRSVEEVEDSRQQLRAGSSRGRVGMLRQDNYSRAGSLGKAYDEPIARILFSHEKLDRHARSNYSMGNVWPIACY